MKPASPTHRRATVARRPCYHRVTLEVLEERFPPGDCVLGSILGSSLLSQNLSLGDAAPWAAEISGTDALAANHRGARPQDSFRLETDWSSRLVLTPPPVPSQTEPGAFQGRSAAAGSTPFSLGNSSGALAAGSALSVLGGDNRFAPPCADPLPAPPGLGGG